MAQTKKKRRRKHRGTQGGRVDDRPKGRPRNRAEARQQAKARRSGGGTRKRGAAAQPRADRPPTWGGAFIKGLFAAILFLVLLVLLMGRDFGPSAAVAGAMVLFYTPMAYYLDLFLYNRRLRQAVKEKSGS